MGDIAHVVQAMLKRLRADLLQDDVAVALHAFDLLAWESSNNHVHLHTRLKQLCKMLRIDSHHVVPALAAGAQGLLPLTSRARELRFPVENRACWSGLLHPSWRAKYAAKLQWTQDCSFLVQFYLSLKMNTTTLERDLGQLLLHLDAHSGPLSSTGSTMASIMEVNIEGPQSEEGFFRPNPDGGPLEPTDFGRLCAKLWLQHFGRRFRYSYKTKKAKAKTVHSPQSKAKSGVQSKPKHGTFANAIWSRTLAATICASKKPGSIVEGLELPLPKPSTLQGTRWASSSNSAASQALDKFNLHTDRKKQRSLALTLKCFFNSSALIEAATLPKYIFKFLTTPAPINSIDGLICAIHLSN